MGEPVKPRTGHPYHSQVQGAPCSSEPSPAFLPAVLGLPAGVQNLLRASVKHSAQSRGCFFTTRATEALVSDCRNSMCAYGGSTWMLMVLFEHQKTPDR